MVIGLIPAHAGKTLAHRASGPTTGAHPRSRGENHVAGPLTSGRRGSSPLTRGKREQRAARRVLRGLIPAHAGKTPSRVWGLSGRRAHPRSRGENAVGLVLRRGGGGSSPLTRGKHPLTNGLRVGGGLIPAHAGKTAPAPTSPTSRRAHPRSRGENARAWNVPDTSCGSSPLTRGKPVSVLRTTVFRGLIPAHAGKTVV